MHQTTVRFGAELWGALEAAAAADGVSISAYVREATLMRVAHAEVGRPVAALAQPRQTVRQGQAA